MNVSSKKPKKSTHRRVLPGLFLPQNFCFTKHFGAPSQVRHPSTHSPKAYIDGLQDFYGRDFIVTPDVLIPRPETEQIIDAVLNLAGKPYLPGIKSPKRQLPESPIILDVGTGSGCIAITIKKELPEANVYATDISESALQIATKNATKHGVNPHNFIISHLLDKVKSKQIPTPDVVVANLPYVDPEWEWLDKPALSIEPSIALYADDHGLALIKQLIDQASELQISYLVLEADPVQHTDIIDYAKNHNYNLANTNGFIQIYRYS